MFCLYNFICTYRVYVGKYMCVHEHKLQKQGRIRTITNVVEI